MPYRISHEPIEERRAELDAIVATPSRIIAFETNEPTRLAYRLREALRAARELDVEPYASLRIRIHVSSPHVYVSPRHEIKVSATIRSEDIRNASVDVRVFEHRTSDFEVIQDILTNIDAVEWHFLQYTGSRASVEHWCGDKYNVSWNEAEQLLVVKRVADAA